MLMKQTGIEQVFIKKICPALSHPTPPPPLWAPSKKHLTFVCSFLHPSTTPNFLTLATT